MDRIETIQCDRRDRWTKCDHKGLKTFGHIDAPHFAPIALELRRKKHRLAIAYRPDQPVEFTLYRDFFLGPRATRIPLKNVCQLDYFTSFLQDIDTLAAVSDQRQKRERIVYQRGEIAERVDEFYRLRNR